ncbi:MAG: helix-turn-helix transcriptional regulator [Spirochaetales bacterium]|nr:helix-turn-helix transcriptional regulator [Spirochaetales bacterium]
MIISKREQRKIHDLLLLYSQVDTLDNYLLKFSEGIANLIECDYHGISLIPNLLLNRKFHFYSNNPSGFDQIYQEEFIQWDILLEILLNMPTKIHSYKLENGDNTILNKLFKDVQEIRPSQDFCYSPINYNNSIIGFMGHARGPNDCRLITEKEFNLIQMVLPSLQAGIEWFTLREKLHLQTLGGQGDIISSILINPLGEIEILNGSSLDLFCEILNIQELSPDLLLSNRYFVDFSYPTPLESMHSKKTLICYDNKRYFLNVLSTNSMKDYSGLNMKLITLRKEKSVYNLSDFAKQYCLSKREIGIVDLISKGYSNKKISETLFIAESTVKRHIYNIFEKTSRNTRFELISYLGNNL